MIQIQDLQEQNVRWSIYFVRSLVFLFIASWMLEVVRIGVDEYNRFQVDLHNPPDCLFRNESWSISIWLYTNLFEPNAYNDCMEYLRRTRFKIFLPRFPEAFASTATHFISIPFELFLDKFGNAIRVFMDKFNMIERISLLIASLFSLCFMIFFMRTYETRVVVR